MHHVCALICFMVIRWSGLIVKRARSIAESVVSRVERSKEDSIHLEQVP